MGRAEAMGVARRLVTVAAAVDTNALAVARRSSSSGSSRESGAKLSRTLGMSGGPGTKLSSSRGWAGG